MHSMIMITETRLEHTHLMWSVVFHSLDHLIDAHGSEVGGGVYTILESIVVYSRCSVWSTVGDYSDCNVGCVHFVAYGCDEVCLQVFILCVV